MFKKIIITLVAVFVVASPAVALAGNANNGAPTNGLSELKNNLNTFGGKTGLGNESSDLKLTIANIVNTILGFLGIIAVIMIIAAGYQWTTAGGNEDAVTKSKERIKNAVIGLVVTLLAFVIVNFAVNQLSGATGVTGGGGGTSVENGEPGG